MTNEDKAKLIYSITGDVERFTQTITGDKQVTAKYKLIDILNKIANGELKEGTRVIWDFDTYIYDGKYKLWRIAEMISGSIDTIDIFEAICLGNLNDEVELIEPNHSPDIGKMAEPTDNTKIEELDAVQFELMLYNSHAIMGMIIENRNKLNEVINKINKGE